jgi:hypothetical protein
MQHRVFIVRRDGCFGELPASMIRLSLIGRSTPETLDLGDAAVAIGPRLVRAALCIVGKPAPPVHPNARLGGFVA